MKLVSKTLKTLLISLISSGLMAQDIPLPTKADIESGNITDQEKIIMDNFEHTGYLQRDYEEQLKEQCAKEGKSESECANIARGGNATSGEKFMGMSPAMMKGLAQAYTMVIGMSDLGGKLVTNADGEWNLTKGKDALCSDVTAEGEGCDSSIEKRADAKKLEDTRQAKLSEDHHKRMDEIDSNNKLTDSEKASLKEQETKNFEEAKKDKPQEKEEEMEDYCKYVAMGTEAIAMFQNQSDQDFIAETPSRTETAQVTALEKQSRAHAARARSVNTQVVGWGASTACYTAMLLGPASVSSPQNWLKLGASTLMWRYYDWEKGEHEKAKSIVDQVAKKLKGAGDCNPVSERDCYCSQPETQNDTKYCMPQIRQRLGQSNDYQLTCIDEKLKEDPQCACAATNTCLDKTIRNNMESMHIPTTATNTLNPFFEMTRGVKKPGSGQFDVNSGSNKLFATATKILRDNADKVNIPLGELSKEQAEMAKGIEAMGLPAKLAKGIAGLKLNKNAEKNLAKFKSSGNKRYRFYSRNKGKKYKKGNSLYFSGGKGVGKKKTKSNRNDYASMMKKFSKKGKKKSKSGSDVLRFAQRASNAAQITKDKSEDIFKIISRRYQVSARKRLEVE